MSHYIRPGTLYAGGILNGEKNWEREAGAGVLHLTIFCFISVHCMDRSIDVDEKSCNHRAVIAVRRRKTMSVIVPYLALSLDSYFSCTAEPLPPSRWAEVSYSLLVN